MEVPEGKMGERRKNGGRKEGKMGDRKKRGRGRRIEKNGRKRGEKLKEKR